ncbi:apolipoprotein D-like [Anopheles cruzii]|uniref:apolipoprotein D-like n=1 Tax=Anopheles cruzii TaxID=68878 RepID=UPI0022EC4785|nr:apolipoprotein D-like [Anopheles cruzii]
MRTVQLLAAVLVLGLVEELANGQIVSLGSCPDNPVVVNFDVARYLGLWYETRRYEQVFQQNGECMTPEYSLNEDGTVRVFNSMVVPPSQVRLSELGSAVLAFPDRTPLEAKLNVSFPLTNSDRTNYFVLATDYDTYAVVWSCFEVGPTMRADSAWILSRTPQMPATAVAQVQQYIDLYLNEADLRTTNQDEQFCCAVDPEVTAFPQCE